MMKIMMTILDFSELQMCILRCCEGKKNVKKINKKKSITTV